MSRLIVRPVASVAGLQGRVVGNSVMTGCVVAAVRQMPCRIMAAGAVVAAMPEETEEIHECHADAEDGCGNIDRDEPPHSECHQCRGQEQAASMPWTPAMRGVVAGFGATMLSSGAWSTPMTGHR
jgi:hypothetical protein